MAIYENSRYTTTRIYARGEEETPTLKTRVRVSFNEGNCSIHTWCAGDTLDGLSTQYYENPDFRWAILDANPNYRTEFEIKVGDLIYIPAFEDIIEAIDVDIKEDEEEEDDD